MTVVDDYLKRVPEPQKAELERVRRIVKKTVPEAEEVITYAMPGFRYKGKYLISFCAFKDHMSVFPGAEAAASVKDELKGYKMSKGTIQFTLNKPLPEPILKQIILTCKDVVDGGRRY